MSTNFFNPFFTVKIMDGLFIANITAAKVNILSYFISKIFSKMILLIITNSHYLLIHVLINSIYVKISQQNNIK